MNITTPGRVTLRKRTNETFEADGYLRGALFLYERDGAWGVSNIATGGLIAWMLCTPEEGQELLQRLADEIDWNGVTAAGDHFLLPPDYQDRIIPAVQRIYAEIGRCTE